MKKYNILLVCLSGFLILLNFFLLWQYGPEVHRWGRVISTLTFLILFLKHFHPKKILLLGALVLLIIADAFALEYHQALSQQAFFALQSLAYLFLVFHISKYLVKQKLKPYQIGYTAIVIFLNCSFIVILGDLLAEEVKDQMVQNLFYVYGIATIFFISGGILYYDRFPNDLSASFLIAVAGFVVSNLMGFPAHFMEFGEFYYLDRMFYVLGTAGLVSYSYYAGKALSSVSGNTSPEYLEDLQRRTFTREVLDEQMEEQDYL
ncbi:hypothetical protein ACXYMT_07870 [Salinimicrobium sp. CAU 1759]